MQIECSSGELIIFQKIATAARLLNIDAYVIGGFVRDKILGRQTKDMDIVCIGDGIMLAEEVSKQFNPQPQVNFFKNFGTAQIKIELATKEKSVALNSNPKTSPQLRLRRRGNRSIRNRIRGRPQRVL